MSWWTAPPAIVAEALTAVPDPLFTALRPGPPASAAAVAASLAGSLAPAEENMPAPAWLLDSQRPSFRQTIAAVRRFRGAVLADPVGTGKTYISLAVAATLNRGQPTACLAPATLLSQWEAAAKELGIPVALCSHQQASRGRLPRETRGLIIIDESHHYRNPHTKRYGNVARWLVGRSAVLVTATPIVNRPLDLGHQLLLAVRDNALAMDGIASLRGLLAGGHSHAALGQLVVENDAAASARPCKISRISAPAAEESTALAESAGLICRLRLSRNDSVATLVRGVLLRAAGSSPAALAATLQRYRNLLLHARDARQAGRALARSELRRFTASLGDQLVWWQLLPSQDGASDLELDDLRVLREVIPSARKAMLAEDAKLARLCEILQDGKPTLVFTASRDTVRYVRERLKDQSLAWCTGNTAGIGGVLLPRDAVLGWFREGPRQCPGPRHLVVTDVAAEGLDLQRAARVVHYDLPWTPMRLEQREGRSVRLGSRQREVEVVRFAPPPALERGLRLEAILARKSRLPAAAGMGPGGRQIWRWRSDVAREMAGVNAVAGTAHVPSAHRGLLAGIAFYRATDSATRVSAAVGWLEPGGKWIDDAETLTERLLAAAAEPQLRPVDPERLRDYLVQLTPLIRARLALTRGRRWLSPDPSPCARAVAARLSELIRLAARQRHEVSLSRLERALAFVAGGHTAGEEMLLERLAKAPVQDLGPGLSRVEPQAGWGEIEVRVSGLIVFGESRR